MLFCKIVQLGCILPGINYPGGDIGLAVIKNSKEKCQKYCQDTPECLYFTWVDDTHAVPSLRKKCFLKNLMNVNNKGKKKNGVFSGPKFCPGNLISLSMFIYFIIRTFYISIFKQVVLYSNFDLKFQDHQQIYRNLRKGLSMNTIHYELSMVPVH